MSKPGSNKTRIPLEDQIEVRLAGDGDIDQINAFYNRIYGKNRTREQFIWEFNSSPAGKALYIIAEHGTKIVGTQCAIPYFVINGKNESILSAKSEDTLVDPEYRGLSLFDKMYFLLFMECRRIGIHFIWGFTYAQKPFIKLGFEIPFQASMGLMVLKPIAAYSYYSKLAKNNSALRKMKILGLCLKSSLDSLLLITKKYSKTNCTDEKLALNSDKFNYLLNKNHFGLKLDEAFLNYRMYKNPYSGNYFQLSIIENGELKASVFYTVNKGLCYLLHLFFTDPSSGKTLIRNLIDHPNLKNCFTIRFWGFKHNEELQKEEELLRSIGFTFLKNGISFVGLSLDKEELNWDNFIISRLASQGTD